MKMRRSDVLSSPEKQGSKKMIEEPIQLDGKCPTIAMIVGLKESKKPKKDVEMVMKKLTHLHLEDKKLEILANLEKCENLNNLYLHDNMIYTLVNDPFPKLTIMITRLIT